MRCLRCIIQPTSGFSGMPFRILLVTIIKLFYIICKVCNSNYFKIIFGLHMPYVSVVIGVMFFVSKDIGVLTLAWQTNQITGMEGMSMTKLGLTPVSFLFNTCAKQLPG